MKYSDYIDFDNYLPNIDFNQVIDETTEEGIQNYYSLLKNEYLQVLLGKKDSEKTFQGDWNDHHCYNNCEVICKVTNFCNQNCIYCFDKKNQQKPRMVLSKERILRLLRLLNEEGYSKIEWTWHGGEFLTVDKQWFDDVCLEMYKYAIKEDIELIFNAQSNGTLLDDEWKYLLDKYNVPIGTSYDWSGQQCRGYELSQEKLSNFYFIISVITKQNVKNLIADSKKASNNGVPFSFNAVFGTTNNPLEKFLDIDEFIQEYKKYLEFFIYDNNPRVPERSALAYIRRALNRSAEICNLDNCLYSNRICINADGELYRCDDTSIEEMHVCNIDELNSIKDFFNGDKSLKLQQLKQTQIQNQCLNCDYLPVCGQGCLNCSLKESKGLKPYSAQCKFWKAIVPYIYDKLGNLTPKEFVKLNPTLKQYLIQQLYMPAYLKEELQKDYVKYSNI